MEHRPQYTSARAWADKGPATKWEDLDEETRTRITQELTVINQQLTEMVEPVIESITTTVLPLIRNYADFMPSVAKIAESIAGVGGFVRRWVPNWSPEVDPEKAWAITQEGIPLAFVPRRQIVDELVAADDRDERREIVLRSKELILDDCRAALVLDEGDRIPESIAMLLPLLVEVFDVLEAGYTASACALGSSVIDSALRRTNKGKKFDYNRTREMSIATKLQEAIAKNDFRVCLAFQPLHSLLEPWEPGRPLPSMPSRHVMAHWLELQHASETDAIIVAMAATSLFLGLVERGVIAELINEAS